MAAHWSQIIEPIIGDRAYEVVVDLAAGRGRNSALLAEKAKRVICVDINPENIEFLRKRFRGDPRFDFLLNDGASLAGLASDSVDLVYCFDAMVHFDIEIVISYIKEIYRVLRPGKFAFLHHSNYTANPGADFKQNPGWRNFMSLEVFEHLAIKNGFSIVLSQPLSWNQTDQLDGIVFLRKGA
jgi:SAM-dependent methyltransferase